MKPLGRAVAALSAVGFVAFCTAMGAHDRTATAEISSENAHSVASDQPKQKASRDIYGNLVAMQSSDGHDWLYSGPDDQIEATRRTLTRLRARCPQLDRNWSHFDKVAASFSTIQDVEGLEEFAGMRLIMVGFDYTPGSIPLQGFGSTRSAQFATTVGSNRDAWASRPGAILCGLHPAKAGLTKFTLPLQP